MIIDHDHFIGDQRSESTQTCWYNTAVQCILS